MAEQGVVIFMDGPPTDWRRTSLALANACPGLTYADASRACRFSQGFLDLVLNPEQLEAAATALTTAGTRARVLPLSERASAPPAFTLMRIGLDDLGLSCLEPKSPALARVPWKRVMLLHLAWVAPEAPEAPSSSQGAIDPFFGNRRFGIPKEQDLPTRQLPPELWFEIVLSAPLARLRIRMNSFVYDCLPERADAASEENLRAVVAQFVARAPRALKTGLVEGAAGDPANAIKARGGDDAGKGLVEHLHDRAVDWELTRVQLNRGVELSPVVKDTDPAPSSYVEPTQLDHAIFLVGRAKRPLPVIALALTFGVRLVVRTQSPFGTLYMLGVWLGILTGLWLAVVGVGAILESVKRRRGLT